VRRRDARAPRARRLAADAPLDLIHRSNCSKQALARVSGPGRPSLVYFPEGEDEAMHRHAIWLISGVLIEPLSAVVEGSYARTS
jgi:hypothetical protein